MEIQKTFILLCEDRAKEQNLSLLMAELLNIDRAAAYRRIRCDTALEIDEMIILSEHFNISLDALKSTNSQQVLFQFHSLYDEQNLWHYLQGIDRMLGDIADREPVQLHIVAMDLPFFRQLAYPNLRRFLIFYWRKTVLNQKPLREISFEDFRIEEPLNDMLDRICQSYYRIYSKEIWSLETVVSVTSRIRYYWESNHFKNRSSMDLLANDLIHLLKTAQDEAATGVKKNRIGRADQWSHIDLYQSEVYLSNNIFQTHVGDRISTFLSYNSMNSLRTENPAVNKECAQWASHIEQNSLLLSKVSIKYRRRFFDDLEGRVRESLMIDC